VPETGVTINFGVQTYMDYMGAKAFYNRFNITTQPEVRYTSKTVYVDPDTGRIVPNVKSSPPISSSIEALKKYLTVISPWNDMMLPGYWNFPPGDKIPADLLLPFPEFIKKHKLEDAAPVLALIAGIDINSPKPALYVVMNFGVPVVESYVNNTFFNPSPHNNSLIYGKSAQLLGSDVIFSSTVVNLTHRSEDGIQLTVENHRTKAKTVINAERLLVAAQPSLHNLGVLDLDEQEKAAFGWWMDKWSFAGVVKTNVIPDNTSVAYVAPTNTTGSPRPYSYRFNWMGSSGYFRVLFTARKVTTVDQAKSAILDGLKVLANGAEFSPTEVPASEVVAITEHSGVDWNQTVDQLKAGFMQQLYSVQGHRGTWYTGNLWCPDYSSNVWAFTETVLPKLLESMT
jgi:hypothetical protein